MDEDQIILESDNDWKANNGRTKQRKKMTKRVNNKINGHFHINNVNV